ncbi:DNA-directed RNA polymerase subunit alpha [Mycoplasma phocimorsus]|uniref:DNA-directed RNA polymerase subunit alpha n=1 Tax=Mycoplasma phocimorsus TaxID=3045839 RepID=A0AAJ1PR53_9MOLU|nr:DNA-directed RNA polymerase subunit alpha [Mycoplasma phocimorsus]MDJ1645812.1 DNA-directed RNA polymerase subunit alpha [Mycoplasma phocimorsus]MDJ1646468.1 DNA-directed RNA polymerase subunit alpha [Mycoplasma phocimorsus]MDJ1646971.1 DNA-directed RNA polymerase subunit alpha [Mycoplasma phocimorsus]MDJ1647419.1 DNA-directed RNA polymerase subunit alpha [Mycoplasma phocimorsus]MDJ1648329.1 DNA-directed RNA polymerase subunit alpha [Mycoplasma phocimorsus]
MEKYAKVKYREVEQKAKSFYETQFTVKPLERGLGQTLGVALRRVMLSSITGVAPFAIRIKNAEHEFSTIKGVVEDVAKIILNLRQIDFSFDSELVSDNEIIKVKFKADEPGVKQYTAAYLDMSNANGVEVVSKDVVIATAETDALEFELFLMPGRGFKSFEENKEKIEALKNEEALLVRDKVFENSRLIALDSDFSPVRKVNIIVKELNSASSKIEEELIIDLVTNNTVLAKDVMSQAAKILVAHLNVIGDITNLDEKEIFEEEEIIKKDNENKLVPISALGLSVRGNNGLRRKGIEYINELVKMNYEELKQVKNLGEKTVVEIKEKLEAHGFKLAEGDN